MERTTILVSRESGDCVVAGEDTGEVVGRRRVPVVVGTAVRSWCLRGDNIECSYSDIAFCIPERHIVGTGMCNSNPICEFPDPS